MEIFAVIAVFSIVIGLRIAKRRPAVEAKRRHNGLIALINPPDNASVLRKLD